MSVHPQYFPIYFLFVKNRWIQIIAFVLLGALAPGICAWVLWPRTGPERRWSAQPGQIDEPIIFPATRSGGRVYLDGDWSFRLHSGDEPTTVKAPHAWNAMPGLEHYAGSAIYSRTFRVPPEWEGRQVMLHFEGVAWKADVDVNGERAGSVGDGLYPASVDITGGVSFDSPNRLQITVSNEHAPRGSAAGRAMAARGGLYREIYLQARPQARVDLIRLANVDYDGGPASLQFSFNLALPPSAEEEAPEYILYISLLRPDGAIIRTHSQPVVPDPSGETPPVDWGAILQEPDPWTLTNPALYSVLTTLSQVQYGEDGEIAAMETMDETFLSFGLRTFTLSKTGFLFNGQEIYIRGVDRADDLGPAYGPVQTLDGIRSDVQQARNAGFNTIRTVYMPPHPALLDECDRTGLFVIEDLPLYNLTEADMADAHMATRAANLLRAMIRRDAHHPSILMWGLGQGLDTSGPAGRKFADQLRALAADLDPTRPVYLAPPPARSEPPAPNQPASINTDFLDSGPGANRLDVLLDEFTAAFPNSPTLVFGQAARARLNNTAGRGRFGAEQNQLFELARARLFIDQRPPLDGDFIHALADYPAPAVGVNFSGLLSGARKPKAAFFWLREYSEQIKTTPPPARRAALPVSLPLPLAIAAALLAFTGLAVWSGFSLGRIMLTDPGQTAPLPEQGAPGDWIAGFLALALPSFLISIVAGALFLDLALQWLAPHAQALPGFAGALYGAAAGSPAAQIALSAAVQAAGLLFSGAAAALFLNATPAAASNLLARCLFPRVFLCLPLLLPWPGPVLAIAPAIWEIALRARTLSALHEKNTAPWAVAALPAVLYACAGILAYIALA
jgi:hypothetical protein